MQSIKKWSLNNRTLQTTRAKIDNFDDDNLFKKALERRGFFNDDNEVTIPVYFYRVNGVIGDEDDFYDRIFTLNDKLKHYNNLYLKFENGLNKKIDNTTIDKIQTEWVILEKRGLIDTAHIIKAIEKSNAIKRFTDSKHNKLIIDGLTSFFNKYFEIHKTNLRNQEVKNILVHIVFWINIYLEPVLREFDYAGITPKALYYGPISKREAYFLYFLGYIGSDVIYVNSESKSPFEEIDPEHQLSQQAETSRFLPLKPFPTERIKNIVTTEAYSAGEELRDTLHSEDSMFYKPWQLINYHVRPLTLRSTYEEISILAKEQSIMRNGWEVGQGVVTIPNFFAKVLGVHENHDKYYDDINELKKLPKTLFIDSLPICSKINKLKKIEFYAVSKNYDIDVERLLVADFWPYKHLQKHVQKLIAECTKDFCNMKGIKRNKKYGVDEQRIIIFTVMLSIGNDILQLLQMFDYPRQVPKCIIYNNEINGELIFEDSILIYFLSRVGMDVVIFNPAGHNDIEIYIDESAYNLHHLSSVAFNLPFKSFSIFGKYIK